MPVDQLCHADVVALKRILTKGRQVVNERLIECEYTRDRLTHEIEAPECDQTRSADEKAELAAELAAAYAQIAVIIPLSRRITDALAECAAVLKAGTKTTAVAAAEPLLVSS